MTLTPTEQQAVKEAAESNCVCQENDCVHKTSFNRGVSFALSNLFEPRCVVFAEWCGKNYTYRIDCLNPNAILENREYDCYWYDGPHNKKFSTKELYTIYQEQLNKQQDGFGH